MEADWEFLRLVISGFAELARALWWRHWQPGTGLAIVVILLMAIFWMVVNISKKEERKKKMFNKRKQQQRLKKKTDEEIIEMAGKILQDAEKVIDDLNGLPEGMPEGLPVVEEILSFREFLVDASSELKKRLRNVVGPETIIGVAEGMRLLYEGMNKNEEIRVRSALLLQKAAYDAKMKGVKTFYSLEGLCEVKQVHESFARKLEFDPEDEKIPWGHFAKQLTALQIQGLYADAAGIEIQPPGRLQGVEQLLIAPTSNDDEYLDGDEFVEGEFHEGTKGFSDNGSEG